MRTDTVECDNGSIGRERFALQVAAFAAVESIAKLCAQLLHIDCRYTATYFLIRSKKDANRTMLYFRMLDEIIRQVHNNGYTSLVISTQQRGAGCSDNIVAYALFEIRMVL